MQAEWLVLFDIDGTLLHSGGCGRAATRLAMQDVFGTAGGVDEVDFAGKTDWQILREALEPTGVAPDTVAAHIADYDQAAGRRLAAIIHDFPVRPCAGAPEVVAALSANPTVLVGLVTGNMAALVPIKLRAAGYAPADFKVGAFGSEGWDRAMLPPLALRRAEAFSGASFAPDHILVVGDTPGDIACATSVQARTLAVATGSFSVAQLSAHHPDYVFETLADREAVLRAVFQNGHGG